MCLDPLRTDTRMRLDTQKHIRARGDGGTEGKGESLAPNIPGIYFIIVLTTWCHKDLFMHWAQALGKEAERMRTALDLNKGFADPVMQL